MSGIYDAEVAAYIERLRAMLLVDTELNDRGDEVFVIKGDGIVYAEYDDPIKACDHAAEMAANSGCQWDMTIQARNAADMS